MKKFIFCFLMLNFSTFSVSAQHIKPEKYYQELWCKEHNGISEFVLDDKARVDCLTKDYAVEFDFAPKWAESIGQALYYGIKTNKPPAVVLILENKEKDLKYLKRLKTVAEKFNIKVFVFE